MAVEPLDLDRVDLGTMTSDELANALDWAAVEGWNPGLSDATSFRAADPDGFLAARIDGRMVGAISSVTYGSTYGFIGMYLVEASLRGRGIGARLWSAAMLRQEGRVCGLDGVVAMQAAYARSGFTLAHRSIRFGGSLAGLPDVVDGVVSLGPANLDAMGYLDEACFGARRDSFLKAWVTQPGALSVGMRSPSGLTGYGTIRPCRDGYKIGPLFAADEGIATRLLSALRVRVAPGAFVYWDIPEPHTAAVGIATALGMVPTFETARMYCGGSPELAQERVFGITTFELG